MSRLDEIRNRLSKATPGPWISDEFSVKTRDDANYGYPPTDGVVCGLNDGEYIENGNYKNDAPFISNSITDIEYLLNEVERLKSAVRLAVTHISGEGTKFSEREKTPVLFQLKEALNEE